MAGKVASKREIEDFLWDFYKLWRGIFILGKDKQNEKALGDLGISQKHREKETRKLGAANYVKGPDHDHDGSEGDVWCFGREVEGKMIYIKLKINTSSAGKRFGKGMSFHPPKWKLKFPHKSK